jgi:hypothetical protein
LSWHSIPMMVFEIMHRTKRSMSGAANGKNGKIPEDPRIFLLQAKMAFAGDYGPG